MTAALALAALWLVLAALATQLPPRRQRLALAALAAAGIPLVGLVTWQAGPVLGFLMLAVGISGLRWPPQALGQRILGAFRRGGE